MVRRAECCCKQCSITVEGEPSLNGICHCDDCKRRTGTAFGWSAYFPDGHVLETSGRTTAYRISTTQPQIRYFCSTCGSTLFWKTEAMRGLTGVAAGNFIENPLPEPRLSVRSRKACAWLSFPAGWALE